jgi:hypothetical protein
LAAVAANYQEWKVLGMVFEFRSLSGNVASGTVAAQGSLTLSVRYDPLAPAPVNKIDALNSNYAVSCKPSESMICPIECDPNETPSLPLRILPAGVPRTDPTLWKTYDPHFYVMGLLDIVTQGAPNDYNGAGELWVTYDVLLLKPRIPKKLSSNFCAHYTLTGDNSTPLELVAEPLLFDSFEPNLVFDSDKKTVYLPYNLAQNSVFQLVYSVFTTDETSELKVPPVLTFGDGVEVVPDTFYNSTTDENVTRSEDEKSGQEVVTLVTFFKFTVPVDEQDPDVPPWIKFESFLHTAAESGDLFITQVNGDLFSS